MMQLKWHGFPGGENKNVEIDHAIDWPYYFSLCKKQDADDPFDYRLFVYRNNSHFKPLGGFTTPQEARDFATGWNDTE